MYLKPRTITLWIPFDFIGRHSNAKRHYLKRNPSVKLTVTKIINSNFDPRHSNNSSPESIELKVSTTKVVELWKDLEIDKWKILSQVSQQQAYSEGVFET